MERNIISSVLALLMISMALSPIINMPTTETKVSDEDQNMTAESRTSEADADSDHDEYTNGEELECDSDPNDANSVPTDTDEDGECDFIDTDDDGDGWADSDENNCSTDPLKSNSFPEDTDEDGVCDELDLFPEDAAEWSDLDGDGVGDNRDDDDDNDGVTDDNDDFPNDACASIDTDGDGAPDEILLMADCRFKPDVDDDNDGFLDSDDDYPLNPCFATDTDGDGLPDDVLPDKNCDFVALSESTDMDDDNDGWPDKNDAFPLDPTEWFDLDNDGIGNNADENDDGDGWSDLFEVLCGTDQWDITSYPVDTDGDGRCDAIDLDDDNDGILDVNDPEPLETAGSWEWATGTGDMVKINDMAMDSNGNILVTGSYKGQTTLGTFDLDPHNREDAFVAKMNSQGVWLWVTTTVDNPKLCANDGGATYTSTISSSAGAGFVETGVYVIETPGVEWYGLSDTINTNTSQSDPSQNFVFGDKVYNFDVIPPEFIGNVSYTTSTSIVLEEPYPEPLMAGAKLAKLDMDNIVIDTSQSFAINQGQWTKSVWSDSFAISNSIAIDGSGDAYITGNFAGYVKFEKTGIDDVLKSYNVRNEGNWLRERYIADEEILTNEVSNVITGYPCGAPDDHFGTGTDMFVAKISSGGDWQWAKGAGSSAADTGEVITLSSDGTHAYVAGDLRQNWCAHYFWVSPDLRDEIALGPGCNDWVGMSERNRGCEPMEHVGIDRNIWGNYPQDNHAGMFNGLNGVSELNGCGAFIAKIKLSNGNWKNAEEITPPNQWLDRPSGVQLPSLYFPSPCVPPSGGVDHCSDKFVSITGMVASGDPERLYLTGTYGKSLKLGSHDIYSGGWSDERGFIAKYIPTTKDWDWVANGCGPVTAKCDEIHDIESNGVWHFFISGCYENQKFVAKYDFTGQEIWFEKFGSRCDLTEIAVDGNGDVYVSGSYSEFGPSEITIGSSTLEHSFDQGHFVAHIDTSGNWVWAEDSIHLVHSYGGHSVFTSFPDGKVWTLGGTKSAKPTGIVVDSSDRVYVAGWMNGAGFFKDNSFYGSKSYVAAIDGPLQIVEPEITINPDGTIPSISMMNTILLVVGASLLARKRNVM